MSDATNSGRQRSPGKRLRFEVFKRDYFTCQYCGAQPPDAVLVVDHVEPFSKGGATTIDNLVTACQPCNAGKSDRSVDARIARPDADLMYLETQQEIAEINRYRSALHDKEKALASLVQDLQAVWDARTGLDWVPRDHIIMVLLKRYSFEVAYEAIDDVATKVAGRYHGFHKSKGWVPYLYAVARNLAIARGEWAPSDELADDAEGEGED